MREPDERQLLKLLERVAEDVAELLIGVEKVAFEARDCDADGRLAEGRAQPLVARAQSALGVPPVRDVVEHEHDAHNVARGVPNGRGAVLDRDDVAVPCDQRGVVREADRYARIEHLLHGIDDRLARVLVDDPEDPLERRTLRLRELPARHRLGGGIQKGHRAARIRRDHRVADAGKRDREPVALLFELFARALEGLFGRDEGFLRAPPRDQDTLRVLQRGGAEAFLLGVALRHQAAASFSAASFVPSTRARIFANAVSRVVVRSSQNGAKPQSSVVPSCASGM